MCFSISPIHILFPQKLLEHPNISPQLLSNKRRVHALQYVVILGQEYWKTAKITPPINLKLLLSISNRFLYFLPKTWCLPTHQIGMGRKKISSPIILYFFFPTCGPIPLLPRSLPPVAPKWWCMQLRMYRPSLRGGAARATARGPWSRGAQDLVCTRY